MHENAFTGTIPEAIQQLQNIGKCGSAIHSLAWIRLLTGILLTSFNTEILFLSSNQFTGTIPEGIERLSRTLHGLYLSDNKLEGTIPMSFCSFGALGA